MKTPRFILSKTEVIKHYNKLRELCNILSYSSKTNQDVTKILEAETDSMFSVHLKNELKHIKDMSRVIFIAQGWDKELIKKLLDKKIRWFVVDNEPDLNILIDYLEKKNEKINLLLRVKLKEHSVRTEKYFVFGMSSEVASHRIKNLKDNKNIKSLGIHFHRKTQNMSEWNLKFELSQMFDENTLRIVDYINIGGGIPSVYANTNADVLEVIYNKIIELREWLNEKKIQLILEPGRAIAAPSCRLVTNIIRIYENTIIVNASVYNSDLDALIVPVKLLVEGEVEKNEGEPYIIKGVSPCSTDLFRYRVYLKEPRVGEKIVFLNAGAYNFSSDFCDLEKLESEVVD